MAKGLSSDSQNVRAWNKEEMVTSPIDTVTSVLQDFQVLQVFQERAIKCIFFHLYKDSVAFDEPS